MSFILQDKNILKLIYKMAADEIPGSVAIDPKIVNKLIDNLYQYSPSKSKAFTGKPDWDRVKISDLDSLNSLLQKIKNSELKIGNLYCVSEAPPAEEVKQAYQKKDNFYVNKEVLKIYLRDVLLRSPSYQTEPLYRALLGSKVKEANSVFGLDIELPEVFKDENIFKFNNTIYLDKDLKDSKGDIALSTSHLSNLDKWFADNRVSLAKSDSLFPGSEKEKKCAFLQYLFTNFSQFRTQIQDAASKYDCGTLKGGESGTQAGRTDSPGGSGFLNSSLRVEMLKDYAPYYGYNDGVIFKMEERGIIPFLTRLIPLADRADLKEIVAASRNLLRMFENFRTNTLGIDVLESTSRSPNMTAQLGELPSTRRNPVAENCKNNLISLIQRLHSQVVLPLCDQLKLDRNDFEVRKNFKISNITSAFTEILAAANAEHPDR